MYDDWEEHRRGAPTEALSVGDDGVRLAVMFRVAHSIYALHRGNELIRHHSLLRRRALDEGQLAMADGLQLVDVFLVPLRGQTHQ